MACLDASFRSSCLLLGTVVLLAGCPDDPVTPSDSESSSTSATGGETCTPGEQESCTCPDGTPGSQTCRADGTGFDACECGVADSTTAGDTTASETGSSSGPGEESTTTAGMFCTSDEDCAGLPVGECEVPYCDFRGMCVPNEAPVGVPCGDQADGECSDPDTCDGAGNCSPNDAIEGSVCAGCPGDQCTCTAGLCGECAAYAPTNNFITTRSIDGWQFTGSWGLHRRTPSTEQALGSEFVGQVLGSNGNRVEPFPGSEIEVSYARTPPTLLPNTIVFLSWNVDEGGGASDNKTVRVSVDGGVSWTTLVDCELDASYPMCQPSLDQDPAVFDLVQIPVPAELQGQVGIVEFGYDTGDACCDFEKGWYIDSLNIARECACALDEDCAAYGTACGTAFCGFAGECSLLAMDEGDPCGDPFENDCNFADECDGVGYCRDNLQASGLTPCEDCPSGDTCSYCEAGQCLDCQTFTDFTGFSDPAGMPGWTVVAISGTPDWGFYDAAPLNEEGVGPTNFPNGPVYGTDGNRNPPYPGAEVESSQVITSIGVVPFELIFGSWNVDEGSGFDTKTIEISVNGGASWTVLESCDQGSSQPFCNFVDASRPIDDWDVITLDTSPWFGQNGQLRFSYATGDSCCGFERGWFLDFSYAICDDVAFP